MFGWLRGKPRCPIPLDEKEWIERRWNWLGDQFGQDVLKRAVVLPTEEFFPDEYDGSEECAREWLDCVCPHMGVDPGAVALSIYSELRDVGSTVHVAGPGTAGMYAEDGKAVVAVEANTLADPMHLVAVMAHELGHVRLIGEQRIDPEEHEDHEPLTDLAVVYFGLGIFPANTAVTYSQWTDGQWSGWSAARTGYMCERMYGYALGLYARARGEDRPPWAPHLRLNVRSALARTLKYLRKTAAR